MKTTLRTSASLLVGLLYAGIAKAGDTPLDFKNYKNVEPPPVALESPWQFSLGIPTWIAATSGTIGLDGVDSDIYISGIDILKHLDMTASFTGEVRYKRFGLYTDFLYISASDGVNQNGLIQNANIRLDEYLIDMELNYRVLEGPKGYLDVRAGVRYTNVYNKLTLTPNDGAIDEASERVVDDIGLRVRDRLASIDGAIRSAVRDRIVERLGNAVEGRDPELPIAPIQGRLPGRVGEVVRTILRDRVDELAAAIRNQVDARTDAARERANKRVEAVKKDISNQIAKNLKKRIDRSASLTEYWWDPYVGIGGRYNVCDAFYLTAKADIGGFGVGSQLTWQASGGAGVNITRNIYAEVVYRYLYTDYESGSYSYDITQSGVQITAGVRF